jgi:NAD(P)-dependent dehydrogenase (short-subunit alcohol dehydrogenase family)
MTKFAYITGADRGLGLALSKVHLRQGYTVFAGSYMPDWPELTELKKEYEKELIIVPLDVSNLASVQSAAEIISKQTDRLDVVINNAAIFKDRSGNIFEEQNYEDMHNLYNTNTLGPLRVTHSVISLLLKGEQKSLVNISSEAASIEENWRTEGFGYSMSKTALNMQCAILQEHLQEYDIKVLAFHPGYVRSYIKGEFNEEATVEASDSAEGIYKVIQEQKDIKGHMYFDYQGRQMPW